MIPRCIRNNNPFNIKKSFSPWIGKVKGDDKVFETFDTLEHGTRAGLKLLLNYVKKGYNTPRKIIARFAPSSENDTKSYLDFVCHSVSIFPDAVFSNRIQFLLLCYAIVLFESGLNPIQLQWFKIDFCYLRDIFTKYNLKFIPYEKN